MITTFTRSPYPPRAPGEYLLWAILLGRELLFGGGINLSCRARVLSGLRRRPDIAYGRLGATISVGWVGMRTVLASGVVNGYCTYMRVL